MRQLLLALTVAGFAAQTTSHPAIAQNAQTPTVNPQTGTVMATYYVVLLRRGPAWTSAVTPETSAVSKGHMDNIRRLEDAGKMVVAGPFLEQSGDRALTGLFVLRAVSAAEAKALIDSDPAVKAGRFVYEILPWMAPATLRR
jgi:uncharacterized protein YciI